MDSYQDKFNDYQFRINWTSSEPFDSRKETVEVRLTTKDQVEYLANFTTISFIDYVFDKNKRTGECAEGTYFCMSNMILVEEINPESIKKTIDDLINNQEFELHFMNID